MSRVQSSVVKETINLNIECVPVNEFGTEILKLFVKRSREMERATVNSLETLYVYV